MKFIWTLTIEYGVPKTHYFIFDSKNTKLTILGKSGTSEKCQNGWFEVSRIKKMAQGLKENNWKRSG